MTEQQKRRLNDLLEANRQRVLEPDESANDEILALHRQLAAEKLRADNAEQRAAAKSRECIELRERMAAAPASQAQAAPTEPVQVKHGDVPSIEITLRQAESLVAFFGGHDAEVSIIERPAAWVGMQEGLYAYCTDYPDEGSQYLGPTEVCDELARNGRAAPAVIDQPTWQVQIRSGDDWRNVMAWDHGYTIQQDTFSNLADALAALNAMETPYEEHSFRVHPLASKEAAPAEVPSQWISVEDRLPEEGDTVLATGPNYEAEGRGYWFQSAKHENGWFDFSDAEGEEHYQPTHWMPLPAAPVQSRTQGESGGEDA